MIRNLSLLASLMLLPAAGFAQDSGLYVGGSVGVVNLSVDAYGVELDDEPAAVRVFGGYQINDKIAVEASYGKTDEMQWSDTFFVSGVGTVTATLVADYEVVAINVYGFAPIGDNGLKLFLGPGYWDADLSATAAASAGSVSGSMSDSASDDGLMLTVGLQFGQRGSTRFRLGVDWFDAEDEVSAWSAGFSALYQF